jgi:hypothetical protein
VSWYLLIVGVGVLALWAVSLPGAFRDGLLDYSGNATTGNVPVFHVVAEGVMAATALTAALLLRRGSRRGTLVAMLANGMLIYSALNSSGWLLQHQPAVLLVTGGTLVGSVAASWMLTR